MQDKFKVPKAKEVSTAVLKAASDIIDAQYGAGYAMKNPALCEKIVSIVNAWTESLSNCERAPTSSDTE